MPGQQPALALVVDLDIALTAELRAAIEALGWSVVAAKDFQDARTQLRARDVAALIANVRLGPFNGIHLAYSARHLRPRTRVLIYALHDDPLLGREAQRAGAFYERQALVPYVLGNFLAADLPAADRRDVPNRDRRATFRGGRRSTDMSSLRPALAT